MRRMIDDKEFNKLKTDIDEKANKDDYVAKEEENTPTGQSYVVETSVERKATTGGFDFKTTRKSTNSYSEVSIPYGAISLKVHDNDGTETTLKVEKDGVYKNNVPMGLLFTSSTDATEDGGIYTLDVSEITGIGINDYIMYIDSGAIKTLYQVASILSGTATLSKIGDVGGGGKQLYLHCISGEKDSGNEFAQITINVITDDATPFTINSLYDYVKNKANKTHTSMSGNTRYLYQATGMARDTGYSQYGAICGVYACTQVGAGYLIIVYGGGSAQNFYYMTSFNILRDDVISI